MVNIGAGWLVRVILARSCKDCNRRKDWAAGERNASAPSGSQVEGSRGALLALSERFTDPE